MMNEKKKVYEKPEVEVIKLDKNANFMTDSFTATGEHGTGDPFGEGIG